MARSNKRSKGQPVKLEMTPMIDVVFQLLIFFIVTLKQEDILSQLQVMRPGGAASTEERSQIEPFTVLIDARGFIFNTRAISEAQLRETVSRFARYNPGRAVVIKATLDSPHQSLIKALDIFALNGVHSVAVFTIQ